MPSSREVLEGRQMQGAGERITYQLATTAWGTAPGQVSVTAYDVTGGGRVDVSASVLVGQPGVAGDVITLPALENLESGRVYRVEVAFTCGTNHFEAWLEVEAEE